MVQVTVDIPDELVYDIEDIMNIYEMSLDELVVTAIRHLSKIRINKVDRRFELPAL